MAQSTEFLERPLPGWVSSLTGLVLIAIAIVITSGLVFVATRIIQRPLPGDLIAILFLTLSILIPMDLFLAIIGYRLLLQRRVDAGMIKSPFIYYIIAGFHALMFIGLLVASIQYNKWAGVLPMGLGLIASTWKLIASGNKMRRTP